MARLLAESWRWMQCHSSVRFRRDIGSLPSRIRAEASKTQVMPMKKFHLVLHSFTFVTLAINCFPANCQQLTLDQIIRMTGGNQPHLPYLQARYDMNGFQISAGPTGSAYESSGASGDFGNQSSGSYKMAEDINSVSDYGGDTANQSPYSQGGLPQTTTALQSLEGGYGQTFGNTSFRSGRHTFGFSNNPEIAYRGVSGNRGMQGRNLPPVSTASVDIDIVDSGPAHGDWERRVYTPSYDAARAIRQAKARGFFPPPRRFAR